MIECTFKVFYLYINTLKGLSGYVQILRGNALLINAHVNKNATSNVTSVP